MGHRNGAIDRPPLIPTTNEFIVRKCNVLCLPLVAQLFYLCACAYFYYLQPARTAQVNCKMHRETVDNQMDERRYVPNSSRQTTETRMQNNFHVGHIRTVLCTQSALCLDAIRCWIQSASTHSTVSAFTIPFVPLFGIALVVSVED